MIERNITKKDIDEMYGMLDLSDGRQLGDVLVIPTLGITGGETISSDRTVPYKEFVDVVCASE